MKFAVDGSLRNLLNKRFNWGDMLYMLFKIIFGINVLHELNLVHCDLHDGNILNYNFNLSCIGDLRSCKPIGYFQNKPNDNIYNIYGLIPFTAPEVLRGKPFTPASDLYSFAMIMWELTSGISPFYYYRTHDVNLSLSICEGTRPEIIDGTPQCYIDLMNTSEVKLIIENWYNNFYEFYYKGDEVARTYLENIDNEQLKEDLEEFWKANKALIKKQHNNSQPQALSDQTKLLNDILERKEKETSLKSDIMIEFNDAVINQRNGEYFLSNIKFRISIFS